MRESMRESMHESVRVCTRRNGMSQCKCVQNVAGSMREYVSAVNVRKYSRMIV